MVIAAYMCLWIRNKAVLINQHVKKTQGYYNQVLDKINRKLNLSLSK